jgi:beta-lactamase regulating signal transducer with metallopeptidase domain
MSAFAWVLALAATLVSGGVGLASAAIVASLTKAPRLRYVACTAALAFALTPPLMGFLLMGFGFTGDYRPPPLVPMDLARSAAAPWVTFAQSPSWPWMLARCAPALLTVYAVGVAACVARLCWRWFALSRVLREARAPDPARLKGVASPLPIRITEQAPSALLIGVRHPVAVLPARALEHMTGAQLHWILAHEEAHARRADNLRLLAEALLRAVLWFNPFVTWATVMAAEAREQLCDQSVLSAADAAQRRAYAETLLLALRLGSQSQVASTLIHPGKRSLSMRLKVIMSPAQPAPAKTAASFVAIAAAGLFTCAVGAAAWAQTPPSAQSPAQAAVAINSDRMNVSKERCEAIFSGNVTLVSGDRRLKADLVRFIMAGDPNKCGALEPGTEMFEPHANFPAGVPANNGWTTGEALGNVVYENRGQIERGQSAEIDFRSGRVVVRP